MDQLNTFVGAIPLDTDVPQLGRFVVEGLGFLSQMVMGTGAAATGLVCTPASSGLGVVIGAGALVQLQTLAPVASGSMLADTTPCVQQGINAATTALAISGSGTWTVYGQVAVTLGGSQVENFYNAANPSLPYSGQANNGQASYTQTQARVSLGITTGSVPSGAVALYTVTVPSGATAVTQSEIVQSAAVFALTVPQLTAAERAQWQQVPGGSSTSAVPPVWANWLEAIVVGGGGDGSGCQANSTTALSSTNASGGGGGGGGFWWGYIQITSAMAAGLGMAAGGKNAGSLINSNNVSIVGCGGGGTALFSSTAVSAGGAAGQVILSTAFVTETVMLQSGAIGSDGQSGGFVFAGNGGNGPWGGAGRAGSKAGIAATSPGAGGGGAYDSAAANVAYPGGAGAAGLILYRWHA